MIVFSQRHPVGGGHRLELLVWHSQERRQDGEGQRLLGFIRHRVLRLWLLRRRERRTQGKNALKPRPVIDLVHDAKNHFTCGHCLSL